MHRERNSIAGSQEQLAERVLGSVLMKTQDFVFRVAARRLVACRRAGLETAVVAKWLNSPTFNKRTLAPMWYSH
jgi:hypothetical protein